MARVDLQFQYITFRTNKMPINNKQPDDLYRGYYTVAQRYELYFLVAKTTFYSLAALVRKILFLPRENKIHIFKPPCNVPFYYIDKKTSIKIIIEGNHPNYVNSRVRLWKINHSDPGCSFYEFYEWYIFQ